MMRHAALSFIEVFFSRLRCMHHIHHATTACLAALTTGDFAPLDAEVVVSLDAANAEVRRAAVRAGRSYLAL